MALYIAAYIVLAILGVGVLMWIAGVQIRRTNRDCLCDRHRGPHNHERIDQP